MNLTHQAKFIVYHLQTAEAVKSPITNISLSLSAFSQTQQAMLKTNTTLTLMYSTPTIRFGPTGKTQIQVLSKLQSINQ